MFKCKKILALVLAIVALAAVAVPAWATEGIANGGTGIIQLRVYLKKEEATARADFSSVQGGKSKVYWG